MAFLTEKQSKVLEFIKSQLGKGVSPSLREIARHFRFKSNNSADCHIKVLVEKGFLLADAGKARSLRLPSRAAGGERQAVFEIPILGSIPAGLPGDRRQTADGCLLVDAATLGFKPDRNTFCLKVSGESMIGRHICPGDFAILDHAREPQHNDVVAALIDGQSTLKTFVKKGGKTYLKAENPEFPNLIPSQELVIQGVLKTVVRQF